MSSGWGKPNQSRVHRNRIGSIATVDVEIGPQTAIARIDAADIHPACSSGRRRVCRSDAIESFQPARRVQLPGPRSRVGN